MAETLKKSASGNRLSREEKRILREIEKTLLDEKIMIEEPLSKEQEQRVQEYMQELQRSLHFTDGSTTVRPAQVRQKESTHNPNHTDSQVTSTGISALTANLKVSKGATSLWQHRGRAKKIKPRRKVGGSLNC